MNHMEASKFIANKRIRVCRFKHACACITWKRPFYRRTSAYMIHEGVYATGQKCGHRPSITSAIRPVRRLTAGKRVFGPLRVLRLQEVTLSVMVTRKFLCNITENHKFFLVILKGKCLTSQIKVRFEARRRKETSKSIVCLSYPQ